MTTIPARSARFSVYRSLRRMGFPWWTCVRIMWVGAALRVSQS